MRRKCRRNDEIVKFTLLIAIRDTEELLMAVPNYRQSREEMVMRCLKRGNLRTPRLAESMRSGFREFFVEPSFPHLAYSDITHTDPSFQGGLNPIGIPTRPLLRSSRPSGR